jgi:PAS domain S-box-containing protein
MKRTGNKKVAASAAKRPRAEEKLKESEARLRALFEGSGYPMGLAKDGIQIMVNPAYLRLFGYSKASQVVGNPLFNDIAPEELPRIREFARRRSKGEPVPAFYETRGIRRDGTVFDMAVAISTYELAGQVYTIGILRDITEQKRTEATLRESEAHLSMVFENAYDPLALYGVEAAGGYPLSLFNPAFLRIASKRVGRLVTADEVLGRPYDNLAREVLLLEEAAINAGRDHMDEAVRTGRIVRWEETQQRPTGEVSSERIDIPVHDNQGRCKYVLRVLHDVTERNRTEHERTALLERVRSQSDALLKFSLDPAVTAGDVPTAARQITEMATRVAGSERASIWLIEPDSTVMRCIDRYELIADRHTADVTIDLAKYPAVFDNLINGRTIVFDDIELDPTIGPLIQDAAHGEDIKSGLATTIRVGGRVIGAVWIATVGKLKKWMPDEIAFAGALGDHMAQTMLNAERERSTRSLHELAGQLMKAEDEERRRIGRDLHDSTGQLLAVLEINMAMLSRTAVGLDARAQALLQECIAQTKQCANSIRTASYLLHPPLLDDLGLVSAIQWQLDGFRLRSGIQVEAKLPAGFVRLLPEDELSLFRVLQEALTNAHRHAGCTLIRVGLERPPEAVTLVVSDNGKGVPPAELASFRSGGSSLGVGLAGMRERLRQLQGNLEIESGPTGTVVRASLPHRQRVPDALPPPGDAP